MGNAMKTYTSVLAQIEKLQQVAKELKARERDGVVERIREAIAVYGLEADELFGPPRKAKRGAAAVAVNRVATAAAKTVQGVSSTRRKVLPVKFKDDKGNTWSGYGHRPEWLKAELEGGASVEDFRIMGTP